MLQYQIYLYKFNFTYFYRRAKIKGILKEGQKSTTLFDKYILEISLFNLSSLTTTAASSSIKQYQQCGSVFFL